MKPHWMDVALRMGRSAGIAVVVLAMSGSALALPSFARQTGAACEQCHTVSFGPALTSYGRQFKLNGYTWSRGGEGAMPLALMVQGGYTHTAKDQPVEPVEHYRVNNNTSIDQVSLFYGGRLSDHTGLFAQVTYSGEDRAFAWDNTDLRYARSLSLGSHFAVVGATVNNNPTVQDLWNTTPAWAFPYIGSALAPTPAAAPFVTGMGGATLGAEAYAMVDGAVYVEAGGYRGLSGRWLGNLGVGEDSSTHLQGVAPYARIAVDRDLGAHHLHVGALVLDATAQPDPTQVATDHYTDVGFDGMYQYFDGGSQSWTVNALVIHEARALQSTFAAGGSDVPKSHLVSSSLEATWAYKSTYALTVGAFAISGSADHLLYGDEPLSGSANGRPDSRGYTLQAEYIPFGKSGSPGRNWLNVRLGLQYTAYQTFNGASTDYDGAGRNAADNNTLFGYAWFMF